MPARHTLHVALTEPLVRHVRSQVAAGRYENASEAVRRALQLLIEQETVTAERDCARSAEASACHHG